MKVTVVVPYYNPPAHHLDRLLASLKAQSMPGHDFEIIVVDDGSDEAAAQRLDEAARAQPGVRAIHHPTNSGWPGRPRNLGMDAARGEFIFFADVDDWFEPEALERMVAYGEEHDSDIVWGRIVGDNRRLSPALFRKNVPDARLGVDPLLALLTVHRLFRTAMLRDNGIRFAEGYVRLEDHMFMMSAYFAARRISILADYPCYHWTWEPDARHSSRRRDRPREYFDSVRRVLDIVEDHMEPGEQRDRTVAHWYSAKSLARLEGPAMIAYSADERQEMFDAVRDLVRDRFPEHLDRYLRPPRQVSAQLLRAGEVEPMRVFATWARGVHLSAVVEAVHWAGDELRATVACTIVGPDGAPLLVERDGEGERWRLPDDLVAQLPTMASPVVTGFASRLNISCLLRNRSTWVVEPAPTTVVTRPAFDAGGVAPMTATAEVSVDVAGAALERSADPIADLVMRVDCAGWRAEARPAAPSALVLDPLARVVDGRQVRPYATKTYANLSLQRTPVATGPPAKANRPAAGEGSQPPQVDAPAGRRRPTLARRLLSVAARLGLTVTDVAPGAILISRGRRAPKTLPVGASVQVVGTGARGRRMRTHKLDDDRWLLDATKPKTAGTTVARIGKRGWLVSPEDPSPQAELNLETQTLQHFVDRHVAWLLQRYEVDLVIDVGANTGQYAGALRRRGYTGHIASFEPVPAFAAEVEKRSAHDDRWTIHQLALGSTEGTVPIHVQRTFSSLLPTSDYGKQRFTTLRELSGTEQVEVPVRRLDTLLDELLEPVRALGRPDPRIYLKMDTQGFDLEVFRGLGERVRDVVALQSEVALLLIYEHMPRMSEALATYESAGFEISGLYPVTREPDGRVIEYDCVMVRAGSLRG